MMKKLLTVSLAILLVAALIAGCGTTSTTPASTDNTSGTTSTPKTSQSSQTPTEPAEPVELTVWESANGPDEFIQKAGEEFTKIHPNITIKYVNVELGDSSGKIALDGPAGVGPDVFAAPHDKIGELVSGGHIEEVSNPDYVKQTALGACVQAVTYEGKIVGYPISAETYAMFYNKALIKDNEVPDTWEGVVEFAKNFNSGDRYGFMMDVGNGYYTILFTTANGNRLFGPTGTDTTKTYLSNADAVNGMKFFQSMKSILNVPAADLTTSIADEAFKAGKVAMYITGPWNIKPFKDAGIDFGVAPLPKLPGQKDPASSFSGTRTMFVSAYSDHPQEAAMFAEFLMSPEMQKLRFEITEALPATSIEVESPYINAFTKQLDYAFPMPSIPEMSNFWNAMNSASANIWDGADVQGELDACEKAILGN